MNDGNDSESRRPATSETDDADGANEPLFRRDVLAAGAATGASALAVGSTSAGAEHARDEIWFDTAQMEHPVDTFHYNVNEWAGTTHAEFGIYAQYAHYDWENAEFHPHLVEDWEVGATEMVLTLREDFTWEDGEPVDAESLLVQWDVYEQGGHKLYDFADDVEATGEYEITISYPEGTNTGIVEHAVLHENASMPPQDWGDFEGQSLIDHDVPEPTASGPLVLTERTDDYHQYEPRDRVEGVADHPYAEHYDWDGYRMRHRASNQEAHQSFIDQELDGIHSLFANESTLQRFPDSVEEIPIPGTFGMGMWFNHAEEPWSDRQVRQAVAHSLDLETVLSSLGQNKKIYHETQTGLPASAVEDWLGSWTPDGFTQYGDEDPSALLDDAGYDMDDIEMDFVVPAGWSDWILMGSQIGDQLGRAGWNVNVNTLGGAYWGRRTRGGDFDVIAVEHSDGAAQNHPFFSLRFKLYGDAAEPPHVASYSDGEDDTVTIDGEVIHIQDAFEHLANTDDRDEQEEIVRTLAKVVNRDLPYIHVAQTYEQSFIDREQWTFPDDHLLMRTQWPLWVLPKTDETLDAHHDDVDDVETPGLLKATLDGDASDDDSDRDDAPADDGPWFDTAQMEHPVDTYHYNVNEWAGTTHAEHGLFAEYAHFDAVNAEFVPHLVEDWEVGATEMVLTLREDFTWEDGDPVDAESLLVQWDVYEQGGHELFDFADSVEATGEYEITIGYPEGTNTGIVEHAVLHENASMPPQDWDDFSGESPIDHDVSEPTASGPLVLTEQTDDYHQYEPRDRVEGVDDHPYAEHYNWNGYRMRHRENNQAAHQSFIDQELDGIHSLFASDAVLARFPDSIEEISIPGTFGMGMWFNHAEEPWSNRQVRQAVAHSFDLESVLLSLGQNKKIYHETQTGLPASVVEDWLGSWTPEGFEQYDGGTADLDSMVEDAGYSMDEIEMDFVVPAGWSDWILMAAQIGDQLGQAGWDVNVNTLGGAYWGRRTRGGDFDVIAVEHSYGPRHNHPYFSLRFKLYGNDGEPAHIAGYADGEDDTVTIDGEEIHIQDTFERLAATDDEAEQRELVRTLAKVVNRDLPYVHVAQKYEQSFIDREKWAFPEEHQLLNAQWPLWILPKTEQSLEDHVDEAVTDTAGLLKARGGVHRCREVQDSTVCDLNDDGHYRDVTGDGSVGQTDVVQFFRRQHREAWKQPELFDFTGNGTVGHGDVVELFEYVATQ